MMAVDFDKPDRQYGKLYTTAQERERARKHLQWRHEAGLLRPIADWDGDLVEGYVSILGLEES